MQRVCKPLQTRTLTDHMKYKAMRNVFEEGPEKHSAEERKQDPHSRILKPCAAVIKHIAEDRNIHAPYHQGVRLGQHFQVIALE